MLAAIFLNAFTCVNSSEKMWVEHIAQQVSQWKKKKKMQNLSESAGYLTHTFKSVT